MYICGKVKKSDYPAPLQLYGVDLPWVELATHLGHELHQDGTMELDAKMKRAQFIENSTEIREMFSFAHPSQVLRSVQMYSCQFYMVILVRTKCWKKHRFNMPNQRMFFEKTLLAFTMLHVGDVYIGKMPGLSCPIFSSMLPLHIKM